MNIYVLALEAEGAAYYIHGTTDNLERAKVWMAAGGIVFITDPSAIPSITSLDQADEQDLG
jgi:hypothetical protein